MEMRLLLMERPYPRRGKGMRGRTVPSWEKSAESRVQR